MAVSNQQTHTLITYYLKEYENKYGQKPKDFNRYRDKWGFQGMIEDYGMTRAKQIVSFYFKTRRAFHPTNYLLFNYDNLNKILSEREEDAENRRKLRAESKKRVEEWRKKFEQQ